MKANPPKGKYQILAEINMIPFIDVALVLLIIFMVMTPFLIRSQLKVQLPKSPAADAPGNRDRAVEIQVQKNGTIYIDGRAVPRDGVEKALRASVPDPKNQLVTIEADRDVPFQFVILVMGAARKLGVEKLGVAVTEEREGAPAPKRTR